MNFVTQSGIKITINKDPFARGGEGDVHHIVSPSKFSNCCVKLYYKKSRLNGQGEQRMRKIQFMAQNPPINWQNKDYILCWPLEAVFQSNEFIGFVMPLAFPDSILLYQLCGLTTSVALGQHWVKKYDREIWAGVSARLKLCTNIASAVHDIHVLQKYVIADLKPENILITNDGKVSIVDCDSLQITDQGKVLFHAPVATAEYSPPEGLNVQPSKNLVHQSWDRFSLAVIFYKVIFGLHPYTATFGGIYQNIGDIPPKIKNGLFVHGSRKHNVKVLPPPHNNFHILPLNLRTLFEQAFDGGNTNPENRPTAEMWGRTLYTTVMQLQIPKAGFAALPKQVQNNSIVKQSNPQPTQHQKQTYTPPAKVKKAPATKYIFWGTALIALLYFGGNYVSPILNYIFGTTISGTIVGINDTPISLDKIGFASSKTNNITIAKSVADSKGNFTLPALRDISQGIYRLKINDQKLYLVLEGTESSINIEGDMTNLDDYAYEISGSKNSAEYKNFMKELKKEQVTEDEFNAFIETTPNSLTALLAALTTKHKKLDIHEKVLNRLKTQFPQSTYIKEYANYINAISSNIATKENYTVQEQLPDVVCMNFSAAEFLILSYNLEIGQIKKDRSVTDINTAYIWKQVPKYAPDYKVNRGTSIDIYLTASLPEICRSTSDESSSLSNDNVSPGKYPYTSTQYLTEGDIESFSSKELRIMRNEIFARHGYNFKTQDMIEYFNHQTWYRSLPKTDDEIEIFKNSFSEIEKYNVNLIKEIEDSRQ